jgi:hypothetical protein
MRFKFEEIDPTSAEFEKLIACKELSFVTPEQSFFRLFCPIFGPGPQAREDSVKKFTEIHRQWFQNDPDSIWCKVTDTEDGKIVGGLLWKIHRTNPFATEKRDYESATWYPEGSQRDYVTQALKIFSSPHEKFMQKPHVCMSSCCPVLF